ncbi:hypothetical protein MVEN_00148300 [Mycena venus]|uniref:F-box domain-containing protein n=1 Tax=Mycena venus TaxID=2733690 RepID=A0A8H6YXH9_9AGAR|nr:hypothetical protein MVEN_00148300 [Mycena venus]
MATSSFSSLPTELLQEIGVGQDHKSLRAVCKALRIAINPLFFSSVVIQLSAQRPDKGLSRLETIASGETGWSTFACALTIHCDLYHYGLEKLDDEVQAACYSRMKESLLPALESLKTIRTIAWSVQERQGYPGWINETILSALPSFPLLNDLSLSGDLRGLMARTALHGFDRLGGLCKLKLSGYDWIQDGISTEASLKISKALSRSPCLTALEVSITGIDLSPIWNTLRTEKIYLEELNTSSVTRDMICYLCSYSGLIRLILMGPSIDVPPAEDLSLSDLFFITALPKHADSLVELSCVATVEGQWGFNSKNAHLLWRLVRLQSLTTSVNWADIHDSGDTVELLLDAIPNLPSLSSLSIIGSTLRVPYPIYEGFFENHRLKLSKRIRVIMRSYRTITRPRIVVNAGERRFGAKAVSDSHAKQWGYKKLSDPNEQRFEGFQVGIGGQYESSDSE